MQGEFAVLNVDTISLGLFAELGDQIQERVSGRRVSADGTRGVHAVDVVFTGKKAQQ